MKEGALKVWWIPQIPGKPFEVGVSDIAQASLLMSVLPDYNAFQFENNIKPDYSNAGGLMVFEDGDWVDWYDDDGNDIDDLRRDPELMQAAILAQEQTR